MFGRGKRTDAGRRRRRWLPFGRRRDRDDAHAASTTTEDPTRLERVFDGVRPHPGPGAPPTTPQAAAAAAATPTPDETPAPDATADAADRDVKVHAERLDERSAPVAMSPSQAMALVAEGRAALDPFHARRPRRPETDGDGDGNAAED